MIKAALLPQQRGLDPMASPFPGMNPYLETPELWPEVHHLLISILAETLNSQLLPRYRVAVEKRVYQSDGDDTLFVGIPDATVERFRNAPAYTNAPASVAIPVTVMLPMPLEIREGYLEVRDVATKEVVTVIEVLSPSNKRAGRGRDAYETKRRDILVSQTHLVEIDLLRGGDAMPYSSNLTTHQYRILISRSQQRPRADLYGFNLRDPIPAFPLPLRSQDSEPVIDLHALLDLVYDRAGYAVMIDYQQSPLPALSESDWIWSKQILQSAGLA
jgi:Protein of unknown function (DUF4058)